MLPTSSALLASCLALVAAPQTDDLTDLSLEELAEVEVTSVSRTAEPLGGAAAAVTVVTNEDIRRSGATTLSDALRQVPGLHIARTSSSTWAIASRGFSSVQSNKLLVLSDTRSIYTPLFSGVSWDSQDLLLEDVERVEVIRGPGGTLWGANAVNGVINITTKNAWDTQGLYAHASAGTEERASAAVRYGFMPAEKVALRIFGQYTLRDGTLAPSEMFSADDWSLGHVGMRGDWDATADDTVTFQADGYLGDIGQQRPAVNVIGRPGPEGPLRVGVSGGNVLGRWRHRFGAEADIQVRAYFDHTRRDDPTYLDTLNTFDVDFQHRAGLPYNQELLWGASYRFTDNRNVGKVLFGLRPADSQDQLFSGFIQDRIDLPASLRLTLGTKLEHNDFSGFEFQPSVRLAWDPALGHTVWGAVSRAVRVPTRLERDVFIDLADPASDPLPRLVGNPDFGSEQLLAYELGYRWSWSRLHVDVAAFYNRYSGLSSLEVGDPFVDPEEGRTIVPVFNRNLTNGFTRGFELAATASVVRGWRVTAGYSNVYVQVEPLGTDANMGRLLAGATPRQQLGIQSMLDLPWELEFDTRFRFVDRVRSTPDNRDSPPTPAYFEADLRLAWRGVKGLEIALVGQNLVNAQHEEFPGYGQTQRGAYLKVAGRYF